MSDLSSTYTFPRPAVVMKRTKEYSRFLAGENRATWGTRMHHVHTLKKDRRYHVLQCLHGVRRLLGCVWPLAFQEGLGLWTIRIFEAGRHDLRGRATTRTTSLDAYRGDEAMRSLTYVLGDSETVSVGRGWSVLRCVTEFLWVLVSFGEVWWV